MPEMKTLTLNGVKYDIVDEVARAAATAAAEAANSKAPMYTYGTTDLEAGVTELESGKLHFVYE